MRIINPIITALLLFAFGGAAFFFLLVALNGFSGETGGQILLASAIAALAVCVGCAVSSFYAARRLRAVWSRHEFFVHVLSVVAFSMLGGVLIMICWFLILFFFTVILGKKN